MQEKIVYYTIMNKENINGKKETDKARNILKKMLKSFDLEMPDIYISENGKPYFKNTNIYFNYSHCQNYIACTISNYEVGIDIEEVSRKISDEVAHKYLEDEKENIKRLEKWVRKEAYSKLKGLGLKIDFKSLNLDSLNCPNELIKNDKYICTIYGENAIMFKKVDMEEYL